MTKGQTKYAVTLPHTLRLRGLALACVVLALAASCIQAVHTHGELAPRHSARLGPAIDASQMPGGEEGCLLCIAMHSALPVASGFSSLSAVVCAFALTLPTGHIPAIHQDFALFGRPPPRSEIHHPTEILR